MPILTRIALVAVVLSITIGGCRRRSPERPAPRRINTDSLLREQARLDSLARAEAARAAASAAAAAAAAAGPATTAPVTEAERTALAATIYFDLDESTIRDDARPVLMERNSVV